jgi:ferrous iron transport protein A
LTLDALPRDASARIAEVQGNDAVSRRLREMGLLAGQSVRRSGTAPLGDPAIYFVRGFRLALRRAEARRVLIDQSSVEPAVD